MKKALLPTICLLLCTLCLIFIPTEAEAAIYKDTLRLHILAPSDSIEDQNLKLVLRDKLLEKYSAALSKANSSADAKSLLSLHLEEIKEDLKRWSREAGYDYSVDVKLSEEWFDRRDYKGFSLPAGKYYSLTVSLGEGEGQNWWCVMYPPMCLNASLSEKGDSFSDEEYVLITKKGYRVKFKLLEVASSLFE